MSDGLIIHSRHNDAFARMAATSKKDLTTLWTEEARICFGGTGSMPGVAGVTPPYGTGALQNTRTAESHARSKVASDIFGLYGTPGEAFDAIKDKSPGDAQAFWYLHKHGDTAGASDLLRSATGSILHKFDDGVHHRRNFRKKTRGFRFYVADPQNLKAYVQLEQDMVWWLAAGWLEPLEALKARIPAGIKKHDAPGRLRIPPIGDAIEISILNEVSYGGQIRDMQRRIRTVLNDYRVARLDRMWEHYLAKLAGQNNLQHS